MGSGVGCVRCVCVCGVRSLCLSSASRIDRDPTSVGVFPFACFCFPQPSSHMQAMHFFSQQHAGNPFSRCVYSVKSGRKKSKGTGQEDAARVSDEIVSSLNGKAQNFFARANLARHVD